MDVSWPMGRAFLICSNAPPTTSTESSRAPSPVTSPSSGPEPSSPSVAALLHGLRDLGYVYGRDFVTEPASVEGRIERISAIAAELARLKVDVIVAAGPALAGLKAARITIPIVMAGAATDPVQ